MTAGPLGARTPSPARDTCDVGYREFYLRYRRPLMAYVRTAFPEADVEAVAQETLSRAFGHWADIGQRANPWPWLAVTARHLACNHLRDEKGSHAAGLQVVDPGRPPATDVADQVNAVDQLRLLAKAMEVLTPQQRLLLTVMIQEGLSGAELARRLGMQPGAVRMHLSRMRALLSERFVSLGGQLALLPLVATLVARLRRRTVGLQQVPWTAVPASFALSVAVLAVGLDPGALGSAPLPGDVVPEAGVSAVVLVDRASGRAGLGDPERGPAATSPVPATVVQSPAAPAVAYHVRLTSTPTRPGETADAGVEVETPAGTVYVEVPVTMQSPDSQSSCPAGVGC